MEINEEIEKRQIGKSDIWISTLGFGGAPTGNIDLNLTEVSNIIKCTYENNIRYFDTAPLYGKGRSENLLGRDLVKFIREEFVISTKVGRIIQKNRNILNSFNAVYDYSYDGARRSLEASLERLGLDSVDILFCHDIDVWTHGDKQSEIFNKAIKGILPALVKLRQEGVIKAFGLGVNEPDVCEKIIDLFDVDCFLLAGRFTLLEQEPLDSLLPKCLERNISIIIGGPYNSGLLATNIRSKATYDYKAVDDDRWVRKEKIKNICNDHGVDIRAAALQYPLRHPTVASIIPGITSIKQLKENLSFIVHPIPFSLWSDLEKEDLVRPI